MYEDVQFLARVSLVNQNLDAGGAGHEEDDSAEWTAFEILLTEVAVLLPSPFPNLYHLLYVADKDDNDRISIWC